MQQLKFRFATIAIGLLTLATSQVAYSDAYFIRSGQDTAPYSFVQTLPRHNNPTLYAFTSIPEPGAATHDFETYVQWTLPENFPPEGEIIESAVIIMLYGFDFTGFGETNQEPAIFRCYEVLEPWQDFTLTWANRPNAGGINDYFHEITDIDAFGPLSCPATELVQGWFDGTKQNYGVAFKSPTARVLGMHSFEAAVADSLKPTLAIVTVEAPVADVPSFSPTSIGILAGILAMAGGVLSQKRRMRQ